MKTKLGYFLGIFLLFGCANGPELEQDMPPPGVKMDPPPPPPDKPPAHSPIQVIHPTLVPLQNQPQRCYASGWCWDRPRFGANGMGLWQDSSGAIWAVTTNGGILRFDPKTQIWSPSPVPTDCSDVSFSGIWGSSPTNIWVVGSGGTILHYDGTTWQKVESHTNLYLSSITGIQENQIWVRGDHDSLGFWNGSEWNFSSFERTALQSFASFGNPETGFWLTVADYSGGWKAPVVARILHHDGTDWSLFPTPTTNYFIFDSIYVFSKQDVWLTVFTEKGGEVWHYDGNDWKQETLPAITTFLPNNTAGYWFTAGKSAKDLWAFGSNGTIVHKEGDKWKQYAVELPRLTKDNPYFPMHQILLSIDDTIWMVGDKGILLHFDGTTWWQYGGEDPADTIPYRLWGATTGEIWGISRSGVVKQQGESWAPSLIISPDTTLMSIWGSSANDVWAVGNRLEKGIAYHFQGTSWKQIALPFSASLNQVTGTGPNDVWVVGPQGLAHFDGTSWTSYETEIFDPMIVDFWANGTNDAWVSNGKELFHSDGTGFTKVTDFPGLDYVPGFQALWGDSSGNLWAGSSIGLYHYNGTSWEYLEDLGGRSYRYWVHQIWGKGPNDIWLVGKDEETGGLGLVHYDGKDWTPQDSPVYHFIPGTFTKSLNQINLFESSDGTLFLFSQEYLLHKTP